MGELLVMQYKGYVVVPPMRDETLSSHMMEFL